MLVGNPAVMPAPSLSIELEANLVGRRLLDEDLSFNERPQGVVLVPAERLERGDGYLFPRRVARNVINLPELCPREEVRGCSRRTVQGCVESSARRRNRKSDLELNCATAEAALLVSPAAGGKAAQVLESATLVVPLEDVLEEVRLEGAVQSRHSLLPLRPQLPSRCFRPPCEVSAQQHQRRKRQTTAEQSRREQRAEQSRKKRWSLVLSSLARSSVCAPESSSRPTQRRHLSPLKIKALIVVFFVGACLVKEAIESADLRTICFPKASAEDFHVINFLRSCEKSSSPLW